MVERGEDLPPTRNTNWKLRGLCVGKYELFFPTPETPPEVIQEAKELCHECPVKNRCKQAARKHKEKAGIWASELRGLDDTKEEYDGS